MAERPLLRGVLHQWAFAVAVGVGALLVVAADGTRATFAATVFACSVATMLGASALYHRVTWAPSWRLWMRRVDHAGIYLGDGWFIHSSDYGVAVAQLQGWYRNRFAWARRPLAEAGLE